MSTACPHCGRYPGPSTAQRKKYAAEKVARGLEVIRRGGSYREAARVAGYTDEAGFSRACLNAYGARPLAIVRRERQERAA